MSALDIFLGILLVGTAFTLVFLLDIKDKVTKEQERQQKQGTSIYVFRRWRWIPRRRKLWCFVPYTPEVQSYSEHLDEVEAASDRAQMEALEKGIPVTAVYAVFNRSHPADTTG